MTHILCKGISAARYRTKRIVEAGAVRHFSVEPTKLAAVLYTYVDGMVDKRTPHRSNHLDLLKTMTDEGTCLLGGAFAEPCDGAVLLFSGMEQAQNFVDKDPYNTAGLVSSYQIRDYMAVVGKFMKK